MQQILSIKVPEEWQSLDNDQLRFVFHLLATEHTLGSPVKTLKKVLLKYPTFPTPTGKTCSVFKGFRVKDRV